MVDDERVFSFCDIGEKVFTVFLIVDGITAGSSAMDWLPTTEKTNRKPALNKHTVGFQDDSVIILRIVDDSTITILRTITMFIILRLCAIIENNL